MKNNSWNDMKRSEELYELGIETWTPDEQYQEALDYLEREERKKYRPLGLLILAVCAIVSLIGWVWVVNTIADKIK